MNPPPKTPETREGARYEAMMLLRYACERNALSMLLNTKRPLYRMLAREMERGAINAALAMIDSSVAATMRAVVAKADAREGATKQDAERGAGG